WEISEPAIYYQAAYLRLLANFFENPIVDSADEVEDLNNLINIFPRMASQ
ncbi:MAG: hypothetical protein F6K56_40585, partial [Moorea sp. SIO3G5]|nr:hypothetical protein [Moorena sp. SIO3G5]